MEALRAVPCRIRRFGGTCHIAAAAPQSQKTALHAEYRPVYKAQPVPLAAPCAAAARKTSWPGA